MPLNHQDRPKVLLFDLGGVIVRWTGLDALSEITGRPRDEVVALFAASDVFTAYEIGACDDAVFIDALISTFTLDMSPIEASLLWQQWVGETYAGTKAALLKLRQNYITACLSNTNALHWAWLPRHIDMEKHFEYRFASHLMNAAKPNAKCYQHAITDMDVSPSDIWFFDDTLINVEAAQSLGMTAFHVNRDLGVIPTLKELGLLI